MSPACSNRQVALRLETLEPRHLLSADLDWSTIEFRSYDGSWNNSDAADWGAAETMMIRMAPAEFADGVGDMLPFPDAAPNPRTISNALFAQDESIENDRRLTSFVWQWGQFLDHDLDFMRASNEAAPIVVDDPDDVLYPIIPFRRSTFVRDDAGVRQPINEITAYIDASNVYGSSPDRVAALRTFVGGRLKIGDDGLLPRNTEGMPNEGGTGSDLFLAGDVRANEQVGLTAMHTLFVREHNRLADAISENDPTLSDELIYQLARAIVAAEMQIITYNEFLPSLLGRNALPSYRGYNPDVSASIAVEFSTAMYRLGHSMLPSDLLVMEGGDSSQLPLRDAFFDPSFLQDQPDRLNAILRGMAYQPAQEVDLGLVDDVRNFLFGAPGSGGLDLAALNIQRGRDHGLPSYNVLRGAYGLPQVTSFTEITRDSALQEKLANLYGSVDAVDAWVGALAEDHVRGASVGPLVRRALVDQFGRLRDGDRFYYENDSTLDLPIVRKVINLHHVTLSRILKWNTSVDDVKPNVFQLPAPRRSMRLAYAGYGMTDWPVAPVWPTVPPADQDADGSSSGTSGLNPGDFLDQGFAVFANAPATRSLVVTALEPDGNGDDITAETRSLVADNDGTADGNPTDRNTELVDQFFARSRQPVTSVWF